MSDDTAKPIPEPYGRARSYAIWVAAIVVVAALSAAAAMQLWGRGPEGTRTSSIGGPFALQDGSGKTVTADSLRGRPFLVYFGYTHCPDVCPTELALIAGVLGKMGDKAVPALFITVDPERDTPKVMRDYASSFGSSSIVGLSGSPQAISTAMRAYRVFSRKGEVQPDGSYSMDHSSIVYLMNREGRFVRPLNLERPPEEAATEIEGYL